MTKRGPDRGPNGWVGEVGDATTGQDPGRPDPADGDRADLGAQDEPVLGLPRLTARDGDLARVARHRAGRRDRADGQQSRAVERLVADDEGASGARLLVALGRVEIDDDDRPAERWPRYALGHVSASDVL